MSALSICLFRPLTNSIRTATAETASSLYLFGSVRVPNAVGDTWKKMRIRWYCQAEPIQKLGSLESNSNQYTAELCSLIEQAKNPHSPLAHAIRNLFSQKQPNELDSLLKAIVLRGLTSNNQQVIQQAIALVPYSQIQPLIEKISDERDYLVTQARRIDYLRRYSPENGANSEAVRFWNRILPLVSNLLETIIVAIDVPNLSNEVEQGYVARGKLRGYYEWISIPATLFVTAFAVTNNRNRSLAFSAIASLAGLITLTTYHLFFRLRPNKISKHINLTQKAREGAYDSTLDRRTFIDNHLIKKINGTNATMRNILLVGEPGVGKSALIEVLARRMANAKKGDPLRNKKIFQLNVESLRRNTADQIQAILDRIAGHESEYIFFLDEIHSLDDQSGNPSALNALKPFLARDQLHIIGATTNRELKGLGQHPEFLERFAPHIQVPGMNKCEALELMQNYQRKHAPEIFVRKEAWDSILDKSSVGDKINPRHAMRLLSSANLNILCARSSESDKLQNMKEELDGLVRKSRQSLDSRQEHDKLLEKIEKLQKKVDQETVLAERAKAKITPFDALNLQEPHWKQRLNEVSQGLARAPRNRQLATEFYLIRELVFSILHKKRKEELDRDDEKKPITITSGLIEQLAEQATESKSEVSQ